MPATKEMIEVMQAYIEGHTIEIYRSHIGKWLPCTPAWDWASAKYRVAPKPIERWAVVDYDGDIRFLHKSEKAAAISLRMYEAGSSRVVRLVEDKQ